MLAQIFKSILLMSAVGGLAAVFLLCLAPITRKLFSPRWQYYIWLTVLIVMSLPVHFKVPSRTPDIPTIITEQAENIAPETSQMLNQAADFQSQKQIKKPTIPQIPMPPNVFGNLANIWFWGMIAILLAKTVKYNLFLRTIHKNSEADTSITNIPKRLAVRKTDMLDAPLVVGLFNPTLFLPNIPLSENDMNYILMHELTHYKRGDILYKWFAAAVLCMHWFNPLVYVVSRQIDVECEVSCDFEVTGKLSDSEKNDYMSMILDMLSRSKSGSKPLTTQMASSKHTLKRRFCMIRNNKATNKFISAVSVLTAVIMLSTTVFASGILTDLATDDYTIEITNNGKKVELTNKPFIENGEIYVPLRETLKKAMSKEEGVTEVKWNDGTIDVVVAYFQGESGMFRFKIGSNYIFLEHITYDDYINNSIKKKQFDAALGFKLPTVLKNSTAYIPLHNMNYILYSFENKRDENNKLRELDYIIYDKSGEIAALKSNSVLLSDSGTDYYAYNTPEYTLSRFFKFFNDGHFETMKNYYTPNCINTFFKDGRVFGIQRAALTEMNINPTEYLKSSDGVYAFVTVAMTPHPESVYDPSETTASFWILLKHQDNGGYLIDSFLNG